MWNLTRVLGLVLVVSGLPQTGSAETLADALIAAYRNSNLLDQNRALLRVADEDVAVAVAALRPVVALNASTDFVSRDSGDTLSATLNLTAEITL
ncbi:MAG: hypothetical protein U1E02_07190, partial [Hydrogenophaga sp.]|nr:hypothetical protein [Hydrogenophaga sp.]